MVRGFLLCTTVLVLAMNQGKASELVHRHQNPSFGGNPLYSAHLLGTANAQNSFQDQGSGGGFSRPSTGQEFADRITSSLVSRVALEIGNQILGENARDAGTFQLDGTTIDFQRQGQQVLITITDAATGGRTQINIPAPVF